MLQPELLRGAGAYRGFVSALFWGPMVFSMALTWSIRDHGLEACRETLALANASESLF